MEAGRDEISQRVAKCSDQEIIEAYQDIVNWKNTGVLVSGPCRLKEIAAAINEEIGWQGPHYREAEEAVLMEASRRFFNIIKNRQSNFLDLRKGDPIWYVDFERGEFERGEVFAVHFKDNKVDSFSVDFECGDFDEFLGRSLGKEFFLSEEAAKAALTKCEEGKDTPLSECVPESEVEW